MKRDLTWPFSAIECDQTRIYSLTTIYSNLADKVFIFASGYQKISPLKSNASAVPCIRSEKGSGWWAAFICWCLTSVLGGIWFWLISLVLSGVVLTGQCSAVAKPCWFTQHCSIWRDRSLSFLALQITVPFHEVYLNECVHLDSLFTVWESYELHLPLTPLAWECHFTIYFIELKHFGGTDRNISLYLAGTIFRDENLHYQITHKIVSIRY